MNNEKEMALQLAKEKITPKYLRTGLLAHLKWEVFYVILSLLVCCVCLGFAIHEFSIERDSFDMPELGIVFAIAALIMLICFCINAGCLGDSIRLLSVLDKEPEAYTAEHIINSLPTFTSE